MIKAKQKDSKFVSVGELFSPSKSPNKTTLTDDKTKEEANTTEENEINYEKEEAPRAPPMKTKNTTFTTTLVVARIHTGQRE